ncbi:hypothetical protein [Kaistella jeonii]|uniref:DNA-directed RNA polymerase n=1 Tax=Kaistella jeonii TaxID=266749 RepID=A0A0C1FDK5_9FLAO|nr:hypothetical protein [Kaistella jeonii]KIA89908.1 hypothetical protein OA86_04655 [Kaistella jeonii]SFB81383.1 hypothetical protein SAMN05421876_102365 [Kaistella jeonii]VEI96151.1 Uncharacterised protein [Kaistella jeonii]
MSNFKKKWARIPKSIFLPETILKFFTTKLNENPPKFWMNEKIAKFYFHVLFRKVTSDWENETFETYSSLCSEILDDYSSNYNKYFDYFVENKILDKLNHKNFPGQPPRCAQYRFSAKIRQLIELDTQFKIVMVDMTDVKTRNTVIEQHIIADIVKHSARHLAKWLNNKLTIDYADAKELVMEGKEFSKYQKISYLAAIENLNANNIFASRNTKTDNRIHSNLTNLPKILRPFLRYDGETLVNYDIKSSQPYFMVALVEFLLQKNSTESVLGEIECSDRGRNSNINLSRIIDNKIKDKSLIWQNLPLVLCSSAFQKDYEILKNWILDGKFYSEMMKILYPVKPYTGRWERRVPKVIGKDVNGKDVTITISKFYEVNNIEEEKGMIKESVFSIFYGGEKNPGREFKDFQKHFPAFCEFLLIMKKNDKTDFPILLQQIESTCVIDFVTKEIAKRYPDMPLFTIHDSIATTESWSENVNLKSIICTLIEEFTNVPPMVEEEHFCLNCLKNN